MRGFLKALAELVALVLLVLLAGAVFGVLLAGLTAASLDDDTVLLMMAGSTH